MNDPQFGSDMIGGELLNETHTDERTFSSFTTIGKSTKITVPDQHEFQTQQRGKILTSDGSETLIETFDQSQASGFYA